MNRTSEQIIESDYLLARAKIIEVAAILDRIERSAGSNSSEDRSQPTNIRPETEPHLVSSLNAANVKLQNVHDAIAILSDQTSDKARRIQELLSRPYDNEWLTKFQPTR